VPRFARTNAITGCRRCGHPVHHFSLLPAGQYAYLLGMYLGDGCISTYPRTHRLTITLDRRYQQVVREALEALSSVIPDSRPNVYRRRHEQTDEVYSYSKAWPCLFPQHGSGKKHLRTIRLSPWQEALVRREPRRLLRGLIHSDGCRSINTIRHPKKTYRYPRYEFTNRSGDIREIFTRGCDLLGIPWRVMNFKTISVARKEAVALMDEFIGPKR
jgi:hypothetical protein